MQSGSTPFSSPAAAPEACYHEVIAAYRATSLSRRPTTIEDYERVLTDFAGFVGGKPIAEVTRRDVLAWRDGLLARGQSATTATRKAGILKTLFGHAVEYELIMANPAERVRGLPAPQRKPRVGFSSDDLRQIFQSPIYTEDYRPVGGGREACFWLPLLALFTGARVEELAQLTVADVVHAPALGHYLDISDEAEHARLKNPSARRRIPLHATLIDCGFLDYAAALPAGGFLFPDLRPNPRGRRGGYFSNFFSGYLRGEIGIADRRKVFHSFRHTFKDACRRVGIDEAVHDALTGHTASGAGRRYGNEHYPLQPLFEAISRYRPPQDLSHLTIASRRPDGRLLPCGPVICASHGMAVGFGVRAGGRTTDSPLIVARHPDGEAWLDVRSNRIIAGGLPTSRSLLVQAWIELRRAELIANWAHGRTTEEFFPIDPLR